MLAGVFLLRIADAGAYACDPYETCTNNNQCTQGFCSNFECKCGNGAPPCAASDSCEARGLFSTRPPGGATIHITDCYGINGPLSYCFAPTCVVNQGNICNACNACGICASGNIQCDGSCNATAPSNASCTGALPVGSHEIADCTSALGWSFDPDFSGTGQVQIFADGNPAGTVTAGLPRPDIGAVYPGRTNSGWNWTIPSSLKDGLAHVISAYGVNISAAGAPQGANLLLAGSPKTVTCSNPPAGTLASAVCGTASGTASDADGSPVSVALYDGLSGLGGVQIGTATAGPAYTVAFAPFTDGQTHTLYAYGRDIPTGTWYQLTGVQSVSCAPTVTLSAAPAAVDTAQSSTLNWTVSNAAVCTGAPAGWFNAATLVNGSGSGSASSGPLATTTAFSLTCTNATAQSAVGTAIVTVNAPPPTATVVNVTDTDYCTVGPGMVIDWQYDSDGRPIGAYQVQVLQGGSVVFDTGKIPKTTALGPRLSGWTFLATVFDVVRWLTGAPARAAAFFANGTVLTPQGAITFSTDYDIRVTVWDADDRPSAWSALRPYTSKPGPWPTTDFTFAPATPFAEIPVQFTDTTGNGPTAWLWTFGDGTGDLTQNPAHTYAAEGTFAVTLSATNSAGTCVVSKKLGAKKPLPQYREVRPGSQPVPGQR